MKYKDKIVDEYKKTKANLIKRNQQKSQRD